MSCCAFISLHSFNFIVIIFRRSECKNHLREDCLLADNISKGDLSMRTVSCIGNGSCGGESCNGARSDVVANGCQWFANGCQWLPMAANGRH